MEFNALMQQGIQYLQSQNYESAAKALAAANQALPGQANTLHFLGIALCQSGGFEEGIERVRESLALAPANTMFLTNYANLLFEHGQQEEAVTQYRLVLQKNSAEPVVWKNIGIAFWAQGRLDEADDAAHKALGLNPRDGGVWNLVGAILRDRKKPAAALPYFERAIELDPLPAEYYLNLALALSDMGSYERALPFYEQSIRRNGASVSAHTSLGLALYQLGRLEEGFVHLQKALAIDPRFPKLLNNLGLYYTAVGKFEDARKYFQQGVEIAPDFPQLCTNFGILELTCGNLDPGWTLYESRFECDDLGFRRAANSGVRWEGQPLAGRKIFVYSEQGFGDTIQFARYIPLLVALGASVVFECQAPLYTLLQPALEAFPNVKVIAHGSVEPKDAHYFVSLLSLPERFATTFESIPSSLNLELSIQSCRAIWHERMSSILPPRVGLCWAGSATHRNDRNRSIALEQFSRITDGVNVGLVSLHKPMSAGLPNSLVGSGMWPELVDLTDKFDDFATTAACIAELDLVISVDTSVAHVAAALGKPTWVLLPYVPDWRWMLNREDSPWYPSMRLFRQPQQGDWTSVLSQVNEALRQRYPREQA